MMWYGSYGPWMVVGMVVMLLFWAGIIGLAVRGIAALTRRYSSHPGSTANLDALTMAKERYAIGEMSREQFNQIKRDLS